jgi:hypothetical protein
MTDQGPRFNHHQEIVLTWLVLGCLIFFFGSIIAVWAFGFTGVLGGDKGRDLLLGHYPAIVGLPAAGAGAFVIVLVFRQTEGPIEFEGLSFKFKGASGPVVLWAFCFAVIAGALKVIW